MKLTVFFNLDTGLMFKPAEKQMLFDLSSVSSVMAINLIQNNSLCYNEQRRGIVYIHIQCLFVSCPCLEFLSLSTCILSSNKRYVCLRLDIRKITKYQVPKVSHGMISCL